MKNFTFSSRRTIVSCCILLCGLVMGVKGWAQPTVLYTGLTSTTPAPSNSRFSLNAVGGFKQVRFQSNQTASASTIGWAFHQGTTGSPDYSANWRPYTSNNTLSVNTYIPYGFANGARYNSGSGGVDGLLPAITSGNYYTFNVTSNSSPSDNIMELLETNFNPVTLSSVSAPASANTSASLAVPVTIITSGTPNANENIFVRYSTSSSFTTSSLLQAIGSGTNWIANIPAQTKGTVIYYYVLSSNKTSAQIASDVSSYGQSAYDMATLSLNNNSGSNYNYTIANYLINPNGDGGFEIGNTFALNGWTTVNALSNQWYIGSTAIAASGTSSAFIGTSSASYTYTTTTSYTSHFYKDVAIPASEGLINLSFSWKNVGESGFDRPLVYYTTTSNTPVAGTPVSSTTAVSGYTLISPTTLTGSSTYTTATYSLPAALAGTTIRLVFTWQNDASGGTQPPASIDNISLISASCASGLSGTKTIGPGGDYTTLTAALAAINANGVASSLVLELNASYVSTSETFPITLSNLSCLNSGTTITIRPASGVTGRSITSANTTATIDFNGGNYYIIDGRSGGTGTASQLTISNTSTTTGGTAIRFINDAANNTIKYTNLSALYASTTSGAVNFLTTTGSNGNDNNTIDNCNIDGGAGATASPTLVAQNGIYSSGTTTTTATNNSGNTISNCNIFNFFNAASTSAGISLQSGNTDWTISGNSFYQTATRTATAAVTVYGITIANTTSGNNFVVTNNYIGGSTTNAGGSAWSITGAFANRFNGIGLSVGTTTASSVQGNTIANFSFTSTSGATANSTSGPLGTGIWGGIMVAAGNVNVGTATANVIGAATGTGSISVTGQTAGGTVNGIGVSGTGTVAVSNNTIGSITASGSSASISTGIIGIQSASTGTVTINNNTIGSTTTANSLNASLAGTGTIAQIVAGINNTGSATAIAITNNTIANLTNAYTSTPTTLASIIRGIASSSGINTITGNTLRNLSTASSSNGTGSTASVIGISMTSTTASASISQNILHSLANTYSGASATSVIGLYYNGPTTGTNLVARNFIHSLSVASSSTTNTAGLFGIYVAGGTTTYQNNMIRLGIDASGAAITGGYNNTGINDANGTNNYYFNSVYIGGASVLGSLNTYAFTSAVTNNIRAFQNNIFFNARSNSTGTGKHYVIQVAGTTSNPTGLTVNYNDYIVTGTGGVFGFFNSADVASLAAWRTAVGQDVNSITGDPQFIAPTGTSSTVDLHISASNPTPIESAGLAISAVTDDYDGQARVSFTPTDLGADAGNFTAADISAPTISYTGLTNTSCTTNRITSSFASITDGSGINATTGTKPRLYYKRTTDANTYVDNTSSTNGWKYVQSTSSSSPYDFTIDYSLLNGGTGVAAGQTIQYFVVAQDLATTPNVGINSGTFAVAPSSVALTSTAFPLTGTINSYNIIAAGLSGTVTIGVGQTYTTLSGTSGLFADINSKGLSGNLTVNIMDASISETGANALNQISYTGCSVSTYTVTIKPNTGVTSTLTGSVASGALIKLSGADYVTIDGSNNGTSSQNLTITNTSTTSPTAIWIGSLGTGAGATNNTIKNCTITTGSNAATSYGIFAGSATAIGTAADDNDNLTIQNNNINTVNKAIDVEATSTGVNDNLSITLNNIGSATAANYVLFSGIIVVQAATATISNNTISNIITTVAGDPVGIVIGTGVTGSAINANTIKTIKGNNTGGYGGRGITINTANASSNLTISNNIVADIGGSGWNVFTSDAIMGIAIGNTASTTGGVKIYYNSVMLGDIITVANATFAGSSSGTLSASLYIGLSANAIDIRNNILVTNLVNSAASTAKTYAIYSAAANTAFSNIDNNDYWVQGTQGVLGNIAATDRASLAQIQTGFGSNANSQNVFPNFTSAINLRLTASGNPTLNNAATSIAAVTTDIDGISRGASPDIGVNEFTPATLDMGVIALVAPAASGCYTSTETVTVTIKNYGASTIDFSLNPVTVTVTESLTGYSSNKVVNTGTLASNATLNVTMPLPINMSGAGTYTFNANTSVTGDANSTNDALGATTRTNSSLGGTYNVGAGQTYITLTAAVAAWNGASCLTGPVTFLLKDATYSGSETFPITINVNANASSTNTLTIKPASTVTTTTITGSVASGALIKLNAASYVTIDGSKTNGGTTKDLTITNTSTTSPTAVWVASTGTGTKSNTIKNVVITNGTNALGSYGIFAGGITIGSTGADNDNFTIQNDSIAKVYYGIYAAGTAATSAGGMDGLIISNNKIGASVNTGYVTFTGISLLGTVASVVSNNEVFNVITLSSISPVGIDLGANVVNASVYNNSVHDIQANSSSGYGAYGINISSSTGTSGISIYNNFIYAIKVYGADGGTTYDPFGIRITGGTNHKIYYNSINVTGSFTSVSSDISAALIITSSSVTGLDIRNNVFANSTTGTGAKAYGVYAVSGTTFGTINYNDYYVTGTGATGGFLNYLGSDVTSLTSWKTATTQEANSINIDPLFISTTNLHVQPYSPVNAKATPVAGITTDIDGDTRDASTPDIGADEFIGIIAPVVNSTILNTAASCIAIAHSVSANVTAGSSPITSVTLNYSYNGVAQTPITMTGGTPTGTSNWTASIPAATPANAIVTWTVTATDGTVTSIPVSGTSYQDAPLTGVTATATASPASICFGSSSTLTASLTKSGNITIGSGTDVSTLSTDGTPYRVGNTVGNQFKNQYLWKASELQAAGLTAGNITAVTLNVVGSGGGTLSNLTVKMGVTTQTAMTTTYVTGLTTVLSLATYPASGTLTTGAQTHTFTTPFNWDGTSNIVLEICDQLATLGSAGTLSGDATAFVSTIANSPSTTNCSGTTGGGTYSVRPNIVFKGNTGASITSVSWSDGTNTYSGNPVTVTPSGTGTYNYTATITASGCTTTATTSVLVSPIPTAPTNTTTASQCGQPTYTATSPVSGATFYWYIAASGGTPVATNTTGSYTPATYTTGTNTIYVSVSNGTCESPRTQINVNVTAPTIVTAQANGSAAPPSTCINSLVSLSAVTSGTYTTYTWTASPATGSGIPSSVTGQTVSITPTAAGTYIYTVTATDGICTATSTVSLTVNALPTTPTITASATRVCSGTSVTLTASSGLSSTYCTPTYTSASASSDYIANVTFAGINNTTGDVATDYTYYNSLTANVTGGSSYPISLLAGGTTTTYAQQFGVWIDYNQNGTFEASEFVFSTTTATYSPTVASGSITVPATAYNGLTRMRIVSRYNTAITSDQSCSIPSAYGEAEDYNVNITGGTINPNAVTYLWSPGGATTQSIVVNPMAPTNYTVTVTNGGNCSATSAPTTITIAAPLAGIYSVGSGTIAGEAGHYSTLTAAVADYNGLCLGGAVTFALTDATYSTNETFPITINVNGSASAANTLTIKPNTGVNATITGNITTSIFKLNGADYVTIDGSNNGSTTRNLTITNTNTGTTGAVIWLASASASDGATNNNIKNTVITGNSSTTTIIGIFSGGTSSIAVATTALAANSNNAIINDSISKAQIGLWATGVSVTTLDNNLKITGNKFGSSTSGDGFSIGAVGIQFQNNASITNNDIQNVVNTGSGSITDAGSQTINFGAYVRNGTNDSVSYNKIHNINIGGSSIIRSYGISVESPSFNTSGSASAAVLYNNFVYDIRYTGTGSSTWQVSGINDNGGYNDKFYYNSVSLTGAFTSTSGPSAAFSNGNAANTTTASLIDVRNNIFFDSVTTAGSTSTFYAHYSRLTANAGNTWDYNDLYAKTTTGTAYVGYYNSANRVTLADWKTATGLDANSITQNPLFVSTTDLHINSANGSLDNLGIPITGITNDIDGDGRSTTTPDIGADEYTATACSGTSGGVALYTGTGVCTSGSATVTATGYPLGTSVTYQWEYSSDNFASDIHDLTGQTTAASATTGTISTNTYYRLRSTCTATSTIWYSVSDTVFVITPLIAGTTPATRCGTGTVTLQATGSAGTTLYWYDAATNGSVVGTGTSFITPSINTTTTYYVSASTGGVTTLGPASPAAEGGTVGIQTVNWDVNFTTLAPTTLTSVDIFPITSGQAGVIKVLSGTGSSGTVLATINYTTNVSGGSTAQTIPINYLISTPGAYSLYTTLPTAGVSRNTSGAVYPYTSSVAKITGNGYDQTYFMGMYNWKFGGGCESGRTAVIATVNTPPIISITPTSVTLCAGSSATLVAGSSNTNYTYTWTPGSLSGASQTVTPSATTTYTVTANDAGTGCVNTESATITVNPVPSTVSVTPATSTVCYGSIQPLAASGGNTTGTATVLSENFAAGAPAWTKTNSSYGGSPSLAAWTQRSDGYYYLGTFHSNDNSEFFISNSDAQGYDVDFGEYTSTQLISPALNTTGYTTLSLSFYHYYRYYSYDVAAAVEISTNGGSTWSTLTNYTTGAATIGSYASFSLATINLNSYIGFTNVKIRFRYETDYGYYWAIDNVLITGTQSVPGQFTWSPATNLFTDAAASTPYTAGSYASTVYAKVSGSNNYTATSTNSYNCPSANSASVSLNTSSYSWTGNSSTDWNTPSNWCNNSVPSAPVDVTVPSVTNQPMLPTTGTFGVRNLDIANNAWVNLNGNMLTVNGTLNAGTGSTGKFRGSNTSGLTVNGGGTAYFDITNDRNTLKTLTANGTSSTTLTIGDSLNITPGNASDGYGTVTATGGNIASGGKMVLKSNSVGTARIGTSTGTITGTVTVERFIPARRAWRFLNVPFGSSIQSIRDAWQEGVNNYSLGTNLNPNPGFGTHITGNNVSTDGYDYNTTTNPSMKVWDSTTNTWNVNEPKTISKTITDFKAYCLFVRGSRAVNLSAGSGATADSTILRAAGILNQGVFSAAKNYIGRDSAIIFVGNPFASSVDLWNGGTGLLNSGRVSGIDKGKFWVWDPRDNGSYGFGGYVTFAGGMQVPNGNTTYTGGTKIQSGQAFMVQLSKGSTNANIGFDESDKIATETNVFGRQAGAPYPVIYTNLLVPQPDNSMALTDGVGAAFGNRFSANVDADDAQKLWNFDENIALVRGTSTLAIEFRPVAKLTDTLFYRLYLRQQPYTLQVFANNILGGIPARAWIVDKYLGTKTEINLNDTTLYNFTPNTDTNSYRNRFMLVFNRQLSTTPVPVTKVTNQSDPNTSGNGITMAATEGTVSITPNPVTTAKNAMLKFSNMAKGNYEVVVYDGRGQKLAVKHIQHDGSNTVYHLPSGASWSAGVYAVTVLNEDLKTANNLKLVISQ